MGKKSRRNMELCNQRMTKGCTGAVNSTTAREPNVCHSCWKSKNSKMLNRRRKGDKRSWKANVVIMKTATDKKKFNYWFESVY